MDAFPHFIASNLCFLGRKLGQKQPKNCPLRILVRSGRGQVTRRRRPRGRGLKFADATRSRRSRIRVTYRQSNYGILYIKSKPQTLAFQRN